MGVSESFFQKFIYSAEQSGVGAKEAEIGLQRFLRRASTSQQEGGALADLLEDMGVEFKNLDGSLKSGEQLFVDFADAMGRIEDPNEKLVKGFKLLDSEGLNLLNLIGEGSERFKKFGEEAEKAGLIIDGQTISSMQDLDGELKKTSTKFKILGARILPSLVKYLNLAVVGWEGIFEAVKMSRTGIELIGKTIKQYLIDLLDKSGSKIDVFKAKLENFSVKINPFADDKDIQKAEMNLAKMEQKYLEVSKRTSDSMEETRQKVLRKDEELANRRDTHLNNLKRLSNEANDILKDRNNINLKDLNTTEKSEQILQRVAKARTDINVQIQQAIERVKALKKGGEAELQIVLQRQKAEDQISQLMKDGNMTRDEASKIINKLIGLENEEKNLHEKIKKEKEEQVKLLKDKKDRDDLLQKLEKEKNLQNEILAVDKRIDDARKKGDVGAEKRLEAKKILIQLRNVEADQKEALGKKLLEELNVVKNKRDVANQELEVLNLLAQGRDKEAQLLQAQLDIQKEIKGIMDDLGITAQEAINRKKAELELENQIAQKKIEQEQQEIKNNAIRELANKRATDAIDREEKKRIQASQKVVRLDKKILELRQKGGNRAEAEIAKLEAIKTREMEIILDDQTKKDLQKLDAEKQKVKDQNDANIKALDKKLKEVRDAEKLAEERQKKNLQNLQKKKEEILENEKKVVLKAKEIFEKVGKDLGNQFLTIGKDLLNKLSGIKNESPNIELKPKIENNVNVNAPDLSGLNSILQKIPSAIANIDFPEFPQIPEPSPTIVKVDVDTKQLLTETTGKNIENALKGKFVNQ